MAALTSKKAVPEISSATREKILQLWRTPSFSASFGGISNLQLALKLEKHIDITRQQLLDIMHSDPDFVIESQKMKKIFPAEKNECSWVLRNLAK